ncbi:hypothetical protein [Serratia ficaria]|uniref:hypothetical protein n=1 Tax=Serratia ficaria TaxID=61651 RepID=UPI0021832A7A|nr:hypothetical protein [Serratia ficaria]CAI2515882.1 Uncharacterised protein [Serratia ficaria]
MTKRYNPDSSVSISHEHAWMRETPEGGYVAHGDYATLFSELEVVKADRDALADRADALAVENGELKSAVTAKAYIDFIESNGWNAGAKTINGKFAGFMDPEVDFGSMVFAHAKKLIDAVETSATDAALAAIQKQAGIEAIEETAYSLYGKGYIFDTIMDYAAELREAK